MLNLNWENPFGNLPPSSPTPSLIVPNQPLPPVSLKAIRAEQRKLIPALHAMRKVATGVLRDIESDVRRGGPLMVKQNQRPVLVAVYYRLPDHPSIVTFFGPVFIHDHAVTMPRGALDVHPLLAKMFTAQYVQNIEPEKAKALAAAQRELGLELRQGLGAPDLAEDRVVVYPAMLGFAARWIKDMKSPIFQMAVNEGGAGNIRAATAQKPMIKRNRKGKPPAPAGNGLH